VASEEEDEVRVGNRYIDGDRRITITEIEDGRACYSVLRSDTGAIWSAWASIPVPDSWVKVGTGPLVLDPVPMCIHHPLREAEAGTLFCPECVDQLATGWAGLSPDEAKEKTTALLLEDQGHD
jgi:hypothetical protein